MTPDWAPSLTRRPLPVAAVAAATLTVVCWRLGPRADLLAFCYLAVAGVVLGFIDVALKRLPDVITLPSYAVGAVLLGLAVPLTANGGARYGHALIGMVALFTLYAVQWLIVPGQIGLGDVKLAGVLGLYLGWLGRTAWLTGALAGFVLAGLTALVLLAGRRATMKSAIPFGPFMLTGVLVAVLSHP